jgi:hypothetical protein
VCLVLFCTVTAHAQSATTFTYQGYLEEDGGPAAGPYDLRFSLYDSDSGGSPVGGTETREDVVVTGGVFAVELDFGAVFGSELRYLEVAVRDGGSSGGYTTLGPREALRPAPSAITAYSLPNVTVDGDGKVGIGTETPSSPFTVSGAIETTSGGIIFPDGTSQTTAGVSSGNAWSLGGNAGTDPASDYLGTSDDTPLELRVSGERAFRLEPATTSDGDIIPNVIGGYFTNTVTDGVIGATIGGGGSFTVSRNRVQENFGTVSGGFGNLAGGFVSTVGGGAENNATDDFSSIGGGYRNISSGASSTVGGGRNNTADDSRTTVGGGYGNEATGSAATVSGGDENVASGSRSSVGGGDKNTAGGTYATVGGGINNTVSSSSSTIAGGKENTASASNTFVGGGEGNSAENSNATIAGGWNNTASGEESTVGGGQSNAATGNGATIGGGVNNTADFRSATIAGGSNNVIGELYATVGGGDTNSASGRFSVIGGGSGNVADQSAVVGGGVNNTSGVDAVVGGGRNNIASGNGATIAGGENNIANDLGATVGGGAGNRAKGNYAVVPGGSGNEARGSHSFAAGRRARAQSIHPGSFVWADFSTTDDSLETTAPNQFLIRAVGGVGIGTNEPVNQLHVESEVSGPALASNHVALIENNATAGGDVLALKTSASTPGVGENFITFKSAGSDIGAIEGNGSGGIRLNTSGADFAEMLPRVDAGASIAPGAIVGVVGGHITQATAGADRLMVVTDRAAVLGNAREGDAATSSPVAFIGQVPVRVEGPVQVGDWIVASGRDDGIGRAVAPDAWDPERDGPIVGQAWAAQAGGMGRVNTAVGLDATRPLVDRLRTQQRALEQQQAEIEALRQELQALRDLVRSTVSTARR